MQVDVYAKRSLLGRAEAVRCMHIGRWRVVAGGGGRWQEVAGGGTCSGERSLPKGSGTRLMRPTVASIHEGERTLRERGQMHAHRGR